MDWRNNQLVGLGAAGLLVVFIIVIIWYIAGGEPSTMEQATVGMQFQCESCGETFRIPTAALEDYDTYSTYMQEYETAVECKLCGEVAAYQGYFCPECNQWYRYKLSQSMSSHVICPKGHAIPEENQ